MILGSIVIASLIGRYLVAKNTKTKTSAFFLSSTNMPWWLLGISMVGTTFSCDTPNLITQLIREGGVARNWLWWNFLITGMVTVFIYSRYWKKSNKLSDLDFYNIRYDGKLAQFLRFYRSIYLGFFVNVLMMGAVTLAFVKISVVFFGLSQLQTVVFSTILILAYIAFGSMRRGLWSDLLHLGIAMAGAVYAAIMSVNYVCRSNSQFSSLSDIINSPLLSDKINILPNFGHPSTVLAFFVIPLAMQWWMVWYPGAEPGGGGYVVERMLASKNEKHAMGAALFFCLIHYALRPWPWIIVALCSLIIFPDTTALAQEISANNQNLVAGDIGYPLMIAQLGHGWMGLIVASLLIAFTSTIGTHLHWGASYLVTDCYSHFINSTASQRRHNVYKFVVSIILLVCSASFALWLNSARQAFFIMLMVGAGTGPVYLLRWLWWRVNPWSEITAMTASITFAIIAELIPHRIISSWFGLSSEFHDSFKFVFVCLLTTASWVTVTYLTRPARMATMVKFYSLVRPFSKGWLPIVREIKVSHHDMGDNDDKTSISTILTLVFVGSIAIYATLFAIGYLIYDHYWSAGIFLTIATFSGIVIYKICNSKKYYLS